MTLAQTLTDASMAADFYSTVTLAEDGTTTDAGDAITDDVWCDDPKTITYQIGHPYDRTQTAHRLVQYPEASGALPVQVVADMITEVGPLAPGEAYALQTVEADVWPETDGTDDPEPETLGYVAVLARFTPTDE